MPNGGSDNCGVCGFNRANGGKWGWPEDKVAFEKAYCTIRDVTIPNPLWTYCANWHTKSEIPDGPILACGLHEKGVLYRRIPWHGKNRPQIAKVTGTCSVCNGPFDDGIQVDDEKGPAQFCCNAHYLEWWKQRHPDCPLERPAKRVREAPTHGNETIGESQNRVFYRIISAPPGYVHPKNYMLAKYRTLEYDSCIAKVKNADNSPFFATIEEARKAMPTDAKRLPFEPENQFLELWESSETS